jgi:hypothetical protein
MTARNSCQPPHTEATDWVFTRLSGGGGQPAAPTRPAERPPAAADIAALAETQPPPGNPEDLQAAYEWLRRERKRLEAYTQAHLARLRSEHQALVAQNHLAEESLILRTQELNRQEELLAHRARAVQQQATELADREKALAGQLEHWWRAHEEFAAVQEASASVRQQTDAQCAVLDALRAETAALQKSRESARVDLETLLAALGGQREARVQEQALLAARQAQWEQRLLDLDRAEAAAQRRVAELDDLEARLRQEFEAQERQVTAERQEITAFHARLRHLPTPTEPRGCAHERSSADRASSGA